MLQTFDQRCNDLCSILLFNQSIDETNENYVKLLDSIRIFYFQDNFDVAYKDILQLFNDCISTSSDLYFINMIKKVSAQPIFYYNFAHKNNNGTMSMFFRSTWKSIMAILAIRKMKQQKNTKQDTDGPCHGDDLVFLFKTK